MLHLVIFGASGDLTARKLVPSLFRLARKGRLPAEVRVVGGSRTPPCGGRVPDRMKQAVRERAKADWDERDWEGVTRRLDYGAADAAGPGGLEALDARLRGAEQGRAGWRMYYLA